MDSTKGLPSFNEIFTGMRNRINVGEAFKGGLDAYNQVGKDKQTSRMTESEIQLKNAQAQEALGKANKDPNAGKVNINVLKSVLSPEMFSIASAQSENGMIDKALISPYISAVNANKASSDKKYELDAKVDLAKAAQRKAEIAADTKAWQIALKQANDEVRSDVTMKYSTDKPKIDKMVNERARKLYAIARSGQGVPTSDAFGTNPLDTWISEPEQ